MHKCVKPGRMLQRWSGRHRNVRNKGMIRDVDPRILWRGSVFLLKLNKRTSKRSKLTRPFHGPYRIVSMDTNTAQVHRVDKPQEDTILVAVDRLRRFPDELEEDVGHLSGLLGRTRNRTTRTGTESKAVSREVGDSSDQLLELPISKRASKVARHKTTTATAPSARRQWAA